MAYYRSRSLPQPRGDHSMHREPRANDPSSERSAELYRLRLQARVWRPAAENFLDDIGLASGARAVDLGCGSMGVLGTLSRAVGDIGTVVGVEGNPVRLAAARAYVAEASLRNTSITEGTPLARGLPSGQFDLVHCRFLFAPFGCPEGPPDGDAAAPATWRLHRHSGTGRIMLECKSSPRGLEQPEIGDHWGIPVGRRQFQCGT